MNKLTQADTNAPQELSPEEMSALTGGTGFRFQTGGSSDTPSALAPPDPC